MKQTHKLRHTASVSLTSAVKRDESKIHFKTKTLWF